MRFQLLCGLYQDAGGRDYVAGDIVICGTDLVRSFGTSRFRRLPDTEAEPPAEMPKPVRRAKGSR